MVQNELEAQVRTVTGKQVKKLRAEGWVPAVLYGPSVQSRPLQLRAKESEAVVRHAGTSHLITLRIAGEKPVQVIVRDMQRDILNRELVHLDLYQVEMSRTLTVEVPLDLVGESPVVERGEGILLQGTQTVEIECLPADLVDAIEVDLSVLTEVDQQITFRDLAVPSTITILSNPDEMVVRVAPVGEAVEEEEAPIEGGAAEPELIRRRKEEEE